MPKLSASEFGTPSLSSMRLIVADETPDAIASSATDQRMKPRAILICAAVSIPDP
ncbi:hypothetical protein MKK63_16850 [Methylobacterium sp. J-088]|uniref:hypothetical protein n=1 Tax=Methylobacterium sp. J-088 TaxID=2836664 RepID=UPI001FBB283A|nr:hypothetical protein [Methylobacterium sp. J-088]MCJ2064370.1 hypothetical protein [Methylobacterium sp. J-088]